MKNIIDYLNESFEENTLWKLDIYFKNHRKEKNQFKKVINHFKAHRAFSLNDLISFMDDNKQINLRQLVSFLDDIIKQDTTNMDFNYKFYLIIKHILDHEEEFDKYIIKKRNT